MRVSRLRGKFSDVGKVLGRTIDSIVENKMKVGYRLTPGLGHVRIR